VRDTIIAHVMLKRHLPLIAAFMLLANVLHAQTTSFIHYGIEQGLAQSQVQAVHQDDEGNLWVGTLAGLTRYNGRTYRSFTKKDSLAEDWITSVCKDKDGNLWFGHWAGGVSRYNFASKKFQDLGLQEYTRFKTVTNIFQDKSGRFWISTAGSGIFIFEPVSGKMLSITKRDGLTSDNVYHVVQDPAGVMWIATDKGITLYDPKYDISARSSFNVIDSKKGLPSDHITSLAVVNKNEIWVGTADAGVMALIVPANFSMKFPEVLFTRAPFVINESTGLGSNFIDVIYEDRSHRIWIGTTGGGITQFVPFDSKDRTEALAKAITNTYSTKQGLDYFNVNDVFEDREGNIWIATDLGLNQYRGERFQIYDESDSLINNLVWSVLSDREGNIWAGTNDGASKISFSRTGTNGKLRHSIRNYHLKDGLSSNVILSLYEDSDGNIWLGTAYGGVCMLEKATGKINCYSRANGLAGDVVYAINSDSKGHMWFGTKEGASRFDPATGTFRNYTTADGLGGNNVYRIFRDSKGNLWFGALGGVLSLYDGSSFRRFEDADGITHRFILSITEDKAGNLWFGAYGGGLYRYDGKEFRNYTVTDGMTTDSPYSLVADEKGDIWIGHNRGVDKLNLKTGKFTYYGKQDGFLGVETNPNASCIDKNGNIWFGTIMGAVKFNPGEDKPNTVEPKISLIGLKVFMKDTVFPHDATFAYDENHLTFTFIGVSLTSPEKVLYQYKLEGFDNEWSPGYTSLNEAVYSNIPPGTYTFMVRASNNDGLWTSEPVKYKFSVKPPFWQTALFYVIMTVFILFLLYGADKVRTKNLQSAKRKLEESVRERTAELAVKNAELAEKNKDITDSIRYAKRIQEAIMPPMHNVKKCLPDSFILYKPKDIVSGDFYWVEKKGDIVMFAAVDCTGHGVPGAFMSIVGHNLLNQAADEDSPGKVLDKLNKLLTETLKQPGSSEYRVRDGMDISLCFINIKTMELQYAGAYNPLYIVRKRELKEYKADALAIGTHDENSNAHYTNHTLQLEKGDMIYIFSDGYVDQFGGPQGKKFKYNQFKELLVSIQDLGPEAQHITLDKAIEDWRSGMEQVDDMLVIGVRV
jgi:ligand-binding sensor domain-containing protein/serine phosphatase RsbU (regulator of sigma subunit)